MARLAFDIPTKIAEVVLPDTSISVQEIVDQCRDFEDYPEMLSHKEILHAEGKGPVGGGAYGVINAYLINGWRIRFAARPGPDVVECNITGGNLIAYTGAVGSTTQIPIAPSDYVFPSYAQATTGALLGSLAPEFQGGVWVDGVLGQSGTSFPTGTSSQPVNNFPDARAIADTYGIRTFYVMGNTSCVGGAALSGMKVEAVGGGQTLSLTGCDVTSAHFVRVFLGGSVVSSGHFFGDYMGFLDDFSGVFGIFTNSMIVGQIHLTGPSQFIDGFEGFEGFGHPGVDFNGAGGVTLQLTRYSGDIHLYGMATGDSALVDLLPGHLRIEPDCTGGDVILRGLGEPVVVDGVLDSLDDAGFLSTQSTDDVMDLILSEKITERSATPLLTPGTLTLKHPVTGAVLAVKDIWENSDGDVGYQGKGIENEGPPK